MNDIIDPVKELKEIQEAAKNQRLEDITPIGDFEIRKASVGMNGRHPILGFAVNDAPYQTSYDYGMSECPAFKSWRAMLTKALVDGMTVCDEWGSFMGYRAWFIDQPWEDSVLDTFLRPANDQIIGDLTACFVPKSYHTILLMVKKWSLDKAERKKPNGLPVGVCFYARTGKYQAKIRRLGESKQSHLGYFATAADAQEAYDDAIYENLELIAESLTPQHGILRDIVEDLLKTLDYV